MKIQTTLLPQLQQQMKLAPQVIQSIEILQLPILALIEHVQQELTDNPVLEELVQPEKDGKDTTQDEGAEDTENKEEPQEDEFKKLREMADEWRDYFSQTAVRRSSAADERDQKQEALENTAAKSL